jgi:hypothetical protein
MFHVPMSDPTIVSLIKNLLFLVFFINSAAKRMKIEDHCEKKQLGRKLSTDKKLWTDLGRIQAFLFRALGEARLSLVISRF